LFVYNVVPMALSDYPQYQFYHNIVPKVLFKPRRTCPELASGGGIMVEFERLNNIKAPVGGRHYKKIPISGFNLLFNFFTGQQ
jgi:hypothetical protein